jgi:hypothetical protein
MARSLAPRVLAYSDGMVLGPLDLVVADGDGYAQ